MPSSFQYLHPRSWSRKTSNGYMDGFLDATGWLTEPLEDSIYSIKNESFPHVIIRASQTKQWVNCCHFTTGPSFVASHFLTTKNTPSLNFALDVVGKKKLKQYSPNAGEFNGNESHGSLSVKKSPFTKHKFKPRWTVTKSGTIIAQFFFQGKTTVDSSEIPMPTNGWMFLKPCK